MKILERELKVHAQVWDELTIVLLNRSSEPRLFYQLQRERTDEDSVGEISLLAKNFPNAIIAESGVDGWIASFGRAVQAKCAIGGGQHQQSSNADEILRWKVLGAKLENAYAETLERTERTETKLSSRKLN